MTPLGMHDMTGWSAVGCEESDRIRSENAVTPVSSLTDPDGIYSSGVIFTEWWADERPLLRDYRYSGGKPCAHFAATGPEAATPDPSPAATQT